MSEAEKIAAEPAHVPPLWKRPFKNAGILLLGRGTQGILSLVYLALAARTLGAADFGALVIIHGLVLTAAQFIRFQSWQAVMHFGSAALKNKDNNTFQHINLFAVMLDMITAILCVGLLLILLGNFYQFTGLPASAQTLAQLYMFGAVFVLLGSAPLGYLRLRDRHDLISIQTTIEPFIRFIGACALFFIGGTLAQFLILWFVAMAIGRIFLMVLSIRHMMKENLFEGFTLSIKHLFSPAKGIWRYVFGTQITSAFNIGNTSLGVILTGALIGPAAAGLFRVAQQFADILIKPANKLLVPAIYTDLTEQKGNLPGAKDLSMKTILMAAAPAIALFSILVVAGQWLILAAVGIEYADAYIPMVILAFGGLCVVASFPLEPLLITNGKIFTTSVIRIITAGAYFALFIALCNLYGLIGAALATCLYGMITAALFWVASMLFLNTEPKKKDKK